MPYYRRYPSNKQLSGEYAYLNRKRIYWKESYDSKNWIQREGRIIRVGRDAKEFFVEALPCEGAAPSGYCVRWVIPDPLRCKDIEVPDMVKNI